LKRGQDVANGAEPQDHGAFRERDATVRDGVAFSETRLAVSESVRQRLIAYLGRAVVEATQAGDLEAARVANEAVAKLLGTPDPDDSERAEVVDLSARRGKR